MPKRTAEDCASSCAFVSAHGHQCHMPPASAKSRYCFHHERKLRHSKEVENAARELFEPLRGGFVSASALTQSLARLFARVGEGRIAPKEAIAMARIADVLLKSIAQSSDEFQSVYKPAYWSQLMRDSFGDLPPYDPPPPPQRRVVKTQEPPQEPLPESEEPRDPN